MSQSSPGSTVLSRHNMIHQMYQRTLNQKVTTWPTQVIAKHAMEMCGLYSQAMANTRLKRINKSHLTIFSAASPLVNSQPDVWFVTGDFTSSFAQFVSLVFGFLGGLWYKIFNVFYAPCQRNSSIIPHWFFLARKHLQQMVDLFFFCTFVCKNQF